MNVQVFRREQVSQLQSTVRFGLVHCQYCSMAGCGRNNTNQLAYMGIFSIMSNNNAIIHNNQQKDIKQELLLEDSWRHILPVLALYNLHHIINTILLLHFYDMQLLPS